MDSRGELGSRKLDVLMVKYFQLLRRRHTETTGKGLCVSLRSLRSLRLRNKMKANIVADKVADLLFGETQSPQRAQRNAKRVGVGLEVCDARDEGCLRRRHTNTTGKGLCVPLRSLRSLRLRNKMMANEFADKDADLLLGETQSPQSSQRNAKSVGRGLDVCDARDEGCLRRRPINTTGKGLCVSLRSLRSLRLRNKMMANEFADKDADLLLGETKSPQRAQRNAKRVGVGLEVCDAREERYMRRRHTETTGKGLCVPLRSLRSLRLRNKMRANIVADKVADLLFGETQSPQRAQRNAKRVGVEVGEKRWRWRVDDKFFLLRRRPINTTGKGLCVPLRSLRSLRLKKYNEANLLANLIAGLLFGETQSSQRAQRNAKRVGVGLDVCDARDEGCLRS